MFNRNHHGTPVKTESLLYPGNHILSTWRHVVPKTDEPKASFSFSICLMFLSILSSSSLQNEKKRLTKLHIKLVLVKYSNRWINIYKKKYSMFPTVKTNGNCRCQPVQLIKCGETVIFLKYKFAVVVTRQLFRFRDSATTCMFSDIATTAVTKSS